MKIEIVMFNDMKYGIRRKKRFLFWYWYECLSRWSDFWFTFNEDYVDKYCKYRTEAEAKQRLESYLNPPLNDYGVPVDKIR